MKVGALVFSTCQGIGIIARSFHRNDIISDVVTVAHGKRPDHPDWYPDALHVTSLRDPRQVRRVMDWAANLDVLLGIETFFLWELVPFCRERGIKTVLQVMYECEPDPLPSLPDLILAPSLLDQQYYPGSVFLPIPVEGVPWRQRTEARVFLHNAGHGGLLHRNGTGVLLDAMRHVRSPVKLILRTQEPLKWGCDDSRVEVRTGTVPFEELWTEGDCLIHPHSFDGLSLPLQEARAAGMLVIGVDRHPDNTWLPKEPLIPVSGYTRRRVSPRCLEFDFALVDPRDVAAKIDSCYGQDISDYSRAGLEWAREMSWEALRPKYLEALEGLCASST